MILKELHALVRRLFAWVTAQHPYVIQILSTFLGVFAAATLALYFDEASERRGANNLLKVMYQDCIQVRNSVDGTRTGIRNYLGLKDDKADVSEEILAKLGIPLDSQAPDEAVIAKIDSIPKLAVFDRQIFNGVVLPRIMIEALSNNIDLYTAMHELTYTKVLEHLPEMGGAHGGYNGLLQEATVHSVQRIQRISSEKAALSFVNPEERPKFEQLVLQAERDSRRTMAKILWNAVNALDTYEDRLFRICHHLESEWRIRECGLKEKDLYAIYDNPTIQLASELSCGAKGG